jgi:hypothetical protein
MAPEGYIEGDGFICEGTYRCLRIKGQGTLVERVDQGSNSFWLPSSQIHDDSEVFTDTGDNSEGRLVVKAWWARKEEWCD